MLLIVRRIGRTIAAGVSVFVVATGLARWAHGGDNAAAAEALFSEGTRLFAAGDLQAACPKFEESKRLEPGIGVTLYLADCYEKTGRLAKAWAEFRDAQYAAARRGDPRANVALERANKLEQRLPRIKVEVPPPASGVPGLEVK